jgi:hypothetical protein
MGEISLRTIPSTVPMGVARLKRVISFRISPNLKPYLSMDTLMERDSANLWSRIEIIRLKKLLFTVISPSARPSNTEWIPRAIIRM